MLEYLLCDTCGATVSTEMNLCDYCGSDFRHAGTSAQLIKLRDDLDYKFIKLNVEDFLKFSDATKYKEHPIVKYRKAKAQLLFFMTNDNILDSQEFCEILHTINQISKISKDYWIEFARYISIIFPTPHTKLYLEDFKNITSFLVSNNLDKEQVVENKLKEQLILTQLGIKFFKEYKFYTNPKNFLNNLEFITKKKYLLEKYETMIIKINN